MPLNGWSDADPSVNGALAVNSAAWTFDNGPEQNTSDGTISLRPTSINGMWASGYDGSVIPTSDGWAYIAQAGGAPVVEASEVDSDSVLGGSVFHLDTTGSTNTTRRYGKNAAFVPATGFTIEFRLKIIACSVYRGWEFQWDDGADAEVIDIKTSGDDLVVKFLVDGTEATVTGANDFDYHVYRITESGADIKLYVDGVLVLEGTMPNNPTATNRMIFGDQSTAAVSNTYLDYIRWYESGAVAPAYSTSALVAQLPDLDDADMSGDLTAWDAAESKGGWKIATITTIGSFASGTTEFGYAYSLNSGASFSAFTWAEITANGQEVDLSAIETVGGNGDVLRCAVRQTSSAGTAAPAAVDSISIDWTSDTTPPSTPTITDIVPIGANIYGTIIEWAEPGDVDFDHVEVSVNYNDAGYVPFSDKGKLEPGGTYMSFNADTTTKEAAGARNADWVSIASPDVSNIGDIVQARIRSVDTEGNFSSWQTSSEVIISDIAALTVSPQNYAY